MRISLQSMTKFLPAILIAALAVSAQAQESSWDGSLTSSSRTAFQASQQRASFPKLENAADEFEKGLEPSSVVHVATANMPALDNSTSPRRLSPQINSAAFQIPVAEVAPVEPQADGTFISDPQAENMWTQDSQAFHPNDATFNGTVSHQSQPYADMFYANQSEYGNGAIALGTGTTFQKSSYDSGFSRSPFPVGPDDCCDEWASFCGDCSSDACGCVGLKTKPGHLGLKWLKGNDACEKTPCRGNRGCKSCNSSCESDCDCSDAGRTGVIKAHSTKKSARKSDCGCSDCQSGTGLFNR